MSDPRRIIDDDSAPEALRALLSHAADDGLEPTRVALVRENLSRSLGTGGAAATTTIGAKLVGVLALGFVAIAAVALFGRGPKGPAEPEMPTVVDSSPNSSSDEPPSDPAPLPPRPAVEAPLPTAGEPAAPVSAEPSSTRSNKAVATPANPKEEFELLLRARRSLDTAPDESLHLAQRHAKKFPESALAEEREVIAVLALVALNRHAEAVRRGKTFLARHPASSHRSAVEAAVAKGSAP